MENCYLKTDACIAVVADICVDESDGFEPDESVLYIKPVGGGYKAAWREDDDEQWEKAVVQTPTQLGTTLMLFIMGAKSDSDDNDILRLSVMRRFSGVLHCMRVSRCGEEMTDDFRVAGVLYHLGRPHCTFDL